MTNPVVSLRNVKKKYCRSMYYSTVYGLKDIASDFFGVSTDRDALRRDEFWAVDDASFDIEKGSCLGVIGANGSGKSTLMKMITGVITQDSGTITTKGRICGLIEIGAGFHPVLTGSENIFLLGTILGLKRSYISTAFDKIVEFAELEDVIDIPVKQYSSGMYARLGFSVAVHSRPDLLIIDEALSVGDAAFQYRSFNKIHDMRQDGVTIIFISHYQNQIERICSECVFLSAGRVVKKGDVHECLDKYNAEMSNLSGLQQERHGESQIIKNIEFYNDNGEPSRVFNTGSELVIKVTFKSNLYDMKELQFDLIFWHALSPVFSISSRDSLDWTESLNPTSQVTIYIPKLLLAPGYYQVAYGFLHRTGFKLIDWFPRQFEIKVIGSQRKIGVLEMPHTLSFEGLS